MILSRAGLGLALMLACSTSGLAQEATPAAVATVRHVSLTAADRTAAIAVMTRTIQAKYVFPDRVSSIVERLNAALASGRYDSADPSAFAARVTEDLRDASKDRHMYLDYAPDDYAASIADEARGGAEAGDESAIEVLRTREAARANDGLVALRILPGNVRYLKITGFQWIDDRTGAAYDDAMRFLRGGDAVIIDLRGNGGGSHAAVRYLLSHFMEGEQLDLTFLQSGTTPEQSHTLDYVPAGRLRHTPLFVLTDKHVGSAAEAFAYDVQQFKLGTLVGENTAGAANNNGFTPVAPGFMLSVSFGRPVHPVSGGNWEGVGVSPDVAVDPERALPSAQSLALKALATRTNADPRDRADWAWALPAVEAQLHPVTLSASRMATLVGNYGGRRVVLHEGVLRFVGHDGVSHRLDPLTQDGGFTVDGYDDRLHVRLTGTTMEMQWIDEPAPTTIPRD